MKDTSKSQGHRKQADDRKKKSTRPNLGFLKRLIKSITHNNIDFFNEKNQINRMRDEEMNVITGSLDIRNIVIRRAHYELIYANTLDNLEEMDKLLKK